MSTAALLVSSTAGWSANDQHVETIVVTASPIEGNPDRFAVTVGVVDRDAILKAGGANLADALVNVPGVTGTSFAAGASRPVIRGFDASRVRLLEDGIGSFDVSDVGPDHGVPIDPLSAQRIEVVRGAATLRYGSQAIGGVVNAINNRVPTVLPDEPLTGEASGAYGTDANLRQGSLLADARLGQFALPRRRLHPAHRRLRHSPVGSRRTPSSMATAIRAARPISGATATLVSPAFITMRNTASPATPPSSI